MLDEYCEGVNDFVIRRIEVHILRRDGCSG